LHYQQDYTSDLDKEQVWMVAGVFSVARAVGMVGFFRDAIADGAIT